MKITDFVKLSAKEANEKMRDGLKKGTISTKQFKELAAAWLKHQGLIESEFGWHTQAELDDMGAYQDTDGRWLLECETVGVSKKDGNGKMVHSICYIPKKAIDYDSRASEVVRAYNHRDDALSADMRAKILTDIEED
jgi:hypothetical protein